jgi:two-component sensor histidine kinase
MQQAVSKQAALSVAPELALSSGAATLPTPARVSSRAYWLCQFAGWSAVAAVCIVSFSSFAPNNFLAIAAIYIWGAFSGGVLTHLWRGFIRRNGWFGQRVRVPFWRLAACVVLLGVVQTGMVVLGFAVARLPGTFQRFSWLPSALITWTLIIAAWTGIYSYVMSIRRAKRLESEALRFEILAKDAELRALQTQINPHFFFNSLNSMRALIYESPDAAAQMVDQLAGVMRYTLTSGSKKTVDLCDELQAVRAYLAIEKIRFEERLHSVFDVEPNLDEVQIPPMALQTLVENAVKYGVERNAAASEIRITIKKSLHGVAVEVANQGSLARISDSTRLGLDNTRKRLSLLNGEDSQLALVERDGWVIATLQLRLTS